MQKVYLLLRNNQQTGPHTLDELAQLCLKPQDLIWVEGKSFGWSYPFEVDALKPYIAHQNPSEKLPKKEIVDADQERKQLASDGQFNKRIHVSLPAEVTKKVVLAETSGDVIEKKAEELRKRVQGYNNYKSLNSAIEPETKYSRNLSSLEEEYTSWVFSKKTNKRQKTSAKKGVLIATIFLLLTTVSYYLIRNSNNGKKEGAVVLKNKPLEKAEQIEHESSIEGARKQMPSTRMQENPAIKNTSSPKELITDKKPIRQLGNRSLEMMIADHNVRGTKPVVNLLQPEIDTGRQQNEAIPSALKQKKSLSKKIEGFFKKLKTKDSDKTGELSGPLPDSLSDRQAQQRNHSPNIHIIELSQFASLSSNERSSGWMIGIQGLKLTLRNNSSYLIQSADAEVRYFNDQNELLDTRIIRFSNIPSKKSSIVSVPDHRLADHIDFRLLSATSLK